MMLDFFKYQGTGNDFILVDNRDKKIVPELSLVKKLCDRRFGIGADGLILLENAADADFSMVYFNSDGAESTMCGNGGRCITAFAALQGIINDKTKFQAVDGMHDAEILSSEGPSVFVSLKMKDVSEVEKYENDFILNTGSPHYIRFVDAVDEVDVFHEGRAIRQSRRFAANGINVNFVEFKNGKIKVRTYERGVEDETLSCGTGVTASALAVASSGLINGKEECHVIVPGGDLRVKYKMKNENSFSDIWLEGPTEMVYKGAIKL